MHLFIVSFNGTFNFLLFAAQVVVSESSLGKKLQCHQTDQRSSWIISGVFLEDRQLLFFSPLARTRFLWTFKRCMIGVVQITTVLFNSQCSFLNKYIINKSKKSLQINLINKYKLNEEKKQRAEINRPNKLPCLKHQKSRTIHLIFHLTWLPF